MSRPRAHRGDAGRSDRVEKPCERGRFPASARRGREARHLANSLAIFVTPDSLRTFRLPSRLESSVHVSGRFHIKPLLRSVTFGQDAHVLAIGRGAVRLIEGSGKLPAHTVPVPKLPKDMADTIHRRSHLDRNRPGESGEASDENARPTRYARVVDEALRPVLSGHERPLIVAATGPRRSIYRSVSSYAHTAEESLAVRPTLFWRRKRGAFWTASMPAGSRSWPSCSVFVKTRAAPRPISPPPRGQRPSAPSTRCFRARWMTRRGRCGSRLRMTPPPMAWWLRS